jgi:hypothetical protein
LNAVSLCLLGYPEQAQSRADTAVALAHELAHPYTLLEGLFCDLVIGLLVRDPTRVARHAPVIDELIQAGKLPT